MLEIYGTIYNIQNGLFNWQEALTNFSDFADSVTISTTTDCKDDSVQILTDYIKNFPKIKLVITDIKFENLDFDGRLKDAALKECKEPYVMLLDADERVKTKDRYKINKLIDQFESGQLKSDAILIPVIDLFHSEKHYKSIGNKWYLHKNKPEIGRGIVNFAKLPNGKILHTRSDTTELIYRKDNSLVNSSCLLNPNCENKEVLYLIHLYDYFIVYHLGWLEKQNRVKQSQFWAEHWNNRAGFDVNSSQTMEELNKIPYWEHNFPLWNEE